MTEMFQSQLGMMLARTLKPSSCDDNINKEKVNLKNWTTISAAISGNRPNGFSILESFCWKLEVDPIPGCRMQPVTKPHIVTVW